MVSTLKELGLTGTATTGSEPDQSKQKGSAPAKIDPEAERRRLLSMIGSGIIVQHKLDDDDPKNWNEQRVVKNFAMESALRNGFTDNQLRGMGFTDDEIKKGKANENI